MSIRSIDRDPELDVVMEAVHQSPKSLAQISRESGVSLTTIRNWDLGRTRRPQRVTMEFVLRACGRRMVIVTEDELRKLGRY